MIDRERIERFVRDLNAAWPEGRFDDLHRYFHPNCVLLPPDGAPAVVGVEAIVAGYETFGEAAKVHAFDIEELATFPFDELAICHMKFSVDYELPDGRKQESGTEIYVLETRGKRAPRIVWRTQLPGD